MPALIQLTGKNSGRIYELEEGTLLIGRNPGRCNIVLEHHAVSREHARIEIRGGQLYVEDLESRNGVSVNGQPILVGPAGRRRINHTDRIEIAGFEFQVEDEPHATTVELITDEMASDIDVLSTVEISSDSSEWRLDENPASKLKAVIRIINDLASAIDLHEVLPRILESLFRSFPQAERAFILLRETPTGEFKPVAAKRRDNQFGTIWSSKTIVDEVLKRKSAILIGDALRDQRFVHSESIHKLRLRSVMCAPLFDVRGDALGILQLEVNDPTKAFVRSDLHVMAGVARHISVVIENSRLHDAALRSQRHQLERRFQHLVEGSIQGIIVHRDLAPLFCNSAWAALHGYTIDEVLNSASILEFVAENDRDRVRADSLTRPRGVRSLHRYEYRGLQKSGTPIWLENLVTIVDWDDQPAVLSTIFDITERKRAEEKLYQSQAELELRVAERTAELARERDLLRTLMDNLPDFVFIKDRNGRFITTNTAHLNVLKARSLQEVRDKTDFDFFPMSMAEAFYRDEQEVMRTGTPLINHEELLTNRDGSSNWVLTTKAPWREANGDIVGIIGITRDITAIKEATQQKDRYTAELERSHRELEQFAAVASHDLQEPLRAVMVYCELLQSHLAGQVDGDGDELMQSIVAGARRMQTLIDALRTYSKITLARRPRQAVSCDRILDEALANLQVAIRESGTIVERFPLPTITADATQLMQVFQNLIGNALKFRSDKALRISIGVRDNDDTWEFVVADNGVGIEARDFDRIFQMFQRVEKHSDRVGTGIGLAICQKVIEQHGGRIWVESKPGVGSSFYFTLPKRTE